ncbi:MAG: J domain-containing protein [Actinomycetota bacterium]
MAKSHYDVLSVAPSADRAVLRRAYHDAARRWHPDRFAGRSAKEAAEAETNMRLVNEAWEVLGDPQRRKTYDIELGRGTGTRGRSGAHRAGPSPGRPMGGPTTPDDDGVIRIDPRLLDPQFLAARRHVQTDQISNRTSMILRAAPLVVLLALLAGIFVFTAYAVSDAEIASPTTVPGPSLGAGIEANDCVSVLTGPALLERPCDVTADGKVIGSRLPDGLCPIGTIREVVLTNGAIACLGPAV